jgi:hypothetical protein
MLLQIVNAVGYTLKWFSLSTKINNIYTTDTTFNLFIKEIKLYAFVADYSYIKLYKFLSKKLRTRYLVLIIKILVLLEHLYILIEILQDQKLLIFIKKSLEYYRDGLIRQPRFLTILY